jgi:hypothetical protein
VWGIVDENGMFQFLNAALWHFVLSSCLTQLILKYYVGKGCSKYVSEGCPLACVSPVVKK